MRDFKIVTDSCCDLDSELVKELGVDYVSLTVRYEGNEWAASLDWDVLSPKKFYDMMREGVKFASSQVNIETYMQKYESILKEGYDILSLSTSSGLSGSVNSSMIAKKELEGKYPDAKIYCVDCLRSSLGQGLIVCRAAEMKKEGKSMEEIVKWIEDNRLKVHQIGTVDDLQYLKRAGRVTGSAAFMADMFRIKPIIISNRKGENFTTGKVIGRKKSLIKLAEFVKENIVDPKEQVIFIVHADCLDDALFLKEKIKAATGCRDVYINYVGPIIGASVGPGMIGIYFEGVEVTV